VFSTAEDGQGAVTIKVFQGEREMATDNKQLGNFDLTGIPSAPRGQPQIEVTFDIDANGIVAVQAKDKATGKEQQIKITASGGLSDAEIQKMVREAATNAVADKARRALVESKNHTEAMAHQVDKSLAEQGATIAAADRTQAEAAIAAARAALSGTDEAALKQATEQLSQIVLKLGEAAQATPPGSGPNSPPDEKVVDPEFEEVGDKRRA